MPREIFVHLLPALFEPATLRGGLAVVLDVLRASTTIIHALAAGATAVIPCGEVDMARQQAATFPAGAVLLGGERGGTRIAGFDLGNSPAEYTPEATRVKTILFTTTNGTRALLRAKEAKRVFIGAFANLNAIIQRLLAAEGPIHLICAGTDGHITLEDCLCAGTMTAAIAAQTDLRLPLSDSTTLALKLLESTEGNERAIVDLMRVSRGGTNLIALGMSSDIEIAARQNTFDIVPELFPDSWQIRCN